MMRNWLIREKLSYSRLIGVIGKTTLREMAG